MGISRGTSVVVGVLIGPVVLTLLGTAPSPRGIAASSQPASQPTVKTAGAHANWIATFSDGTRIELASVSHHPSEGKPWWTPEGRPLPAPLWDAIGIEAMSAVDELYEITFEIKSNRDKANLVLVRCPEGGSPISAGIPSQQGALRRQYRVAIGRVPKTVPQDDVNLLLGLPSDDWRTLSSARALPGGACAVGGEVESIFSPPYEIGSDVVLTVTHTMGDRNHIVRVVAIDRAGEAHVGQPESGTSIAGMHQLSLRFPSLALAQIRRFELQASLVEWVKFERLRLHPAGTTAKSASASVDG